MGPKSSSDKSDVVEGCGVGPRTRFGIWVLFWNFILLRREIGAVVEDGKEEEEEEEEEEEVAEEKEEDDDEEEGEWEEIIYFWHLVRSRGKMSSDSLK